MREILDAVFGLLIAPEPSDPLDREVTADQLLATFGVRPYPLWMDKIFKLLQKFRLDKYYKKFIDLGIKEELDFFDSVNDMTLKSMDFSQAERNRYDNMIGYLQRIGSAPVPEGMPVTKSLNSFHISYRFPKCPGIQEITGLDPAQNTVEDLMLRICHENKVDRNMSVCLYTADGMPLTDDPFFNTWSLNDRHIASGSELYAIFTRRENLTELPPTQRQANIRNEGPSVIRCHIMLQGDFEIKVDFESDTLRDVTQRLSLESSIPAPVLHIRGEEYNHVDKLSELGITEDSVLQFYLSSYDNEKPSPSLLFQTDVRPFISVHTGILVDTIKEKLKHCGDDFKKVVAYIRRLSGCNALAQSLFQMICRNFHVTRNQKNESDDLEYYATISLKTYPTGQRLSEPVRVPGTPEVFDRSYILEKITDNLGVYLNKDKGDPFKIRIYDCLSGKETTKNVNDLAKILNDTRTDNTVEVSKTPKEAIVVLFDSSSSMMEECYDTVSQMKRIDAVKQIFDSFSNRSMSYDFQHVICLVMFNDKVKTLLKFTENLEAFKEQVHAIEASGYTRLYDALVRGIAELDNIKKRFPACRCRILCLTDGNDFSVLKKKIRESKSGRFMEKEKRIIEELKSLHCDPHPFCSVYPSETDFTFWRIVMKGPPDTPYENGTFELYCQFGDDYPVKPPVVRFYTPQYIGESNVKVPPHLVCPLTGKIFIDPVKAKSGCVYERRAIEEYLKTNKNDPVTGKPLSGTDLTPDKNMKKSVMEYRTSQIEETDP
ncbi:bifunctional E2 E3 enzyme [Labeo rohita]|uniref:Bifunctional E2 E3 enzyme n=1 Tax=Labeo rohita TaxID=84645 RepID=A0A498NEX3_LABRO|nr:bifunctional E2 E3 enzyme [Labeo rohita]